MKRYISVLFFMCATVLVFAQNEVGTPDANNMEDGLPQQALAELSIDKFESEGFWYSAISSDTGFAASRLFEGGPSGKTPLEGEGDVPDTKVLGTRVDFLRRGHTSLFIMARRPIPIEGLTKTISVQVAGRNYNHKMSILIQDFYGRPFEIYMGRLNFQGWKKLTAAIPPQQETGLNGIVQENFHFRNISGIKVIGFRIDCDPSEAIGTYYVYLDDLRAVSDLFADRSRDPDDPIDDW